MSHTTFFNLNIAAGISPCLSLHHRDAGPYDIPNVLACPFNVRKTNPTHLGFNCVKFKEGLVFQLVEEKKSLDTSILAVGQYRLVFTSYCDDADVSSSYSIPMISTLADHDTTSYHCYATPLTIEIITRGIAWLKGVDGTTQFQSNVEALKEYLATLKDVIPLQQPLDMPENISSVVEQVRSFITGHMPDEEIPREISEFVNNPNKTDFGVMSNLIRKFIYSNVAKKTKVVMHIVDGAHRLSAIECAMTGILPSDKVKSNYHERLTHANVLLTAYAMIPDDDHHLSSADFVEEMKTQSKLSQESSSRQQPHGARQFLAHMMQHVNSTTTSYIKFNTNDHSMAAQIEFFAKEIIGVVRSEGKKIRHMIKGLNELLDKGVDEWSCLFKQKLKGHNNYGKFSFLWSDGKLSIQHIMSNGCLGSVNQYSRMGFPAQVFQVMQLLLWTRISEKSYKTLHDCITTNSSTTVQQISASDADGKKEGQWLSALVGVIGTSVYYSNWVFQKSLNKNFRENLLARLLESSITDATQFFSSYGLDPSPPDWYNNVITKMKEETSIDNVLQNIHTEKNVDISGAQSKIETTYKPLVEGLRFVSFINVSFALHLQSQLIVLTGGKSKLRSDLDLSKFQINHVEDIKVIQKNDGLSWTTSITDFSEKIAPDLYCDGCEENTAIIIKKIIDTNKFFCTAKKKAAADVAEVVVEDSFEVLGSEGVVEDSFEEVGQVTLDMQNLVWCAPALQDVLKCFRNGKFRRHVQSKIRSGNITNDQKQLAKRLIDLIVNADPQYLDQCYLREQDLDHEVDD